MFALSLKRVATDLPRDAAVMEPSLWKSADRCCSVAVRAVICAWSYVARYSPSPPRFVSQLHDTSEHVTLSCFREVVSVHQTLSGADY